MRFLGIVSAAAAVFQAAVADFAPPRYVVDLGVDPEHRWDHVVAAQREDFRTAYQAVFNDPKLKDLLPIGKLVIGNELEAQRLLPHAQYLEIKGIARGLGMEASELVLVAAFYDIAAAGNSPLSFRACSGIVAQSSTGEIFHGRNLDYDFKDALSKATIVVDFARDNKTLFTAVTFGPSPGFNTAVKYGSFSATQDERDRGSILSNLIDVIIRGRVALFADFRTAMESDSVATFEDAVKYFSEVKLSAAAYFILGGTKPGEGALVTRDRDALVDVYRMGDTPGKWYVLETNYDHDKEPPFGDDRRHPEMRLMDATGPSRIGLDTLWDVLSITKVNKTAGEREPLNSDTIYTTIMQASNPATFKTMVRQTQVEQVAVVV